MKRLSRECCQCWISGHIAGHIAQYCSVIGHTSSSSSHMELYVRLVDNIPASILLSCTAMSQYAKYYFGKNFVFGRADRGARFRSQVGNTQ